MSLGMENYLLTFLRRPRFCSLELPRSVILVYSRLCLGHHNLLPKHLFRLSLNFSSFCSLHYDEVICNFHHILINCPLTSIRNRFLSCLCSLGYFFRDNQLLNSCSQSNILFIYFQSWFFNLSFIFIFIFNISVFVFVLYYYLFILLISVM